MVLVVALFRFEPNRPRPLKRLDENEVVPVTLAAVLATPAGAAVVVEVEPDSVLLSASL